MNWTFLILIAAVIVFIILMKKSSQIAPSEATTYLRNGALVIDVRSLEEYGSEHLPQAVNIPLDQIDAVLPGRIKDKNQVLLLHCHSGMRSAMAAKKLKSMGYAKAYNLGSYSRAAAIVSQPSAP